MILILFLARFLAAPFAGQRFLHPLLFTRLEVKRVPFHVLNDIFLLYFRLKRRRAFSRDSPS